MDFLSSYMDLSKLINGFIWVIIWICKRGYIDLFKLLLGFVLLCISCPLPNKTKLTLDQVFKACWSFCFEQKVLNESKCSMTWVRCAFGNIFFLLLQSQFSIFWSGSHSTMVAATAVLNSSPTVGGDGGNILWALCCIFGQFPSAQPSLSLANILLCSHHCHHPKFYHPSRPHSSDDQKGTLW